jgi:hypothetical protein
MLFLTSRKYHKVRAVGADSESNPPIAPIPVRASEAVLQASVSYRLLTTHHSLLTRLAILRFVHSAFSNQYTVI